MAQASRYSFPAYLLHIESGGIHFHTLYLECETGLGKAGASAAGR
jgi:hypothetical protein